MEILWQIVLPLLVGALAGAFSSWATFRIRFERAEATDQEREEARKEWRKNVEKRLDHHSERLTELATHEYRIAALETAVTILRERGHDLANAVLRLQMKDDDKSRDS